MGTTVPPNTGVPGAGVPQGPQPFCYLTFDKPPGKRERREGMYGGTLYTVIAILLIILLVIVILRLLGLV